MRALYIQWRVGAGTKSLILLIAPGSDLFRKFIDVRLLP